MISYFIFAAKRLAGDDPVKIKRQGKSESQPLKARLAGPIEVAPIWPTLK